MFLEWLTKSVFIIKGAHYTGWHSVRICGPSTVLCTNQLRVCTNQDTY